MEFLKQIQNLTCSIQRTYIQTWQRQVEFRVLFTNDISVFTNENSLCELKILKILQIDISTQLTKKIRGIPYLLPSPGQEAFLLDTNLSVTLPYNNLSGI